MKSIFDQLMQAMLVISLSLRHIAALKFFQFAGKKVARSAKNKHYVLDRKPIAMNTCTFQKHVSFKEEWIQ